MPESACSPSTVTIPTTPTTTIRCIGPYEILAPSKDTPTLWLTPAEASDVPEFNRIMNLSPTISQGLYAESVVFPYPAENSRRFIERHVESRKRQGINYTFVIRIGSPESHVPMIGLVSLDKHDHGDEGLCVYDPTTDSVENLLTHPLVPVTTAAAAGESASIASTTAEAGPSQESIQESNEAQQRVRAAAEGKRVLNCGVFGYSISDEHAGKGYMTRVVHYMLNHLRQEFGYDRVHAEGWEDNPATLRVMSKAGMTYNTTRTIFVPKFRSNKQCAEYIWDAPLSK
ncbi:hypothetical protein DFQ27_001659 [Actinomortierella ambigua]|uniref:N-acetyltransferase domain-containing protein n=1 Tax=Actinomortierella ambigua TaxID=1343610 RepID=A0A9P6QDN2_9FUNG|nr:hypothetical protein DFQ27_001659 [Actinomortierella ambigua]